jgi:AraC-like DNA-binding protein
MRTRDVDEAIDAVSRLYCPHSMCVTGRASGLDAVVEVLQSGPQQVIRLSYAAPVKIDAGNFPELFLAIRSTGGSGTALQNGRVANWRAGQTLLFSADAATQVSLERDFSHTSVRLDSGLLATVCAQWLGRPLKRRLRFEFTPFSVDLERAWSHVLSLLTNSGAGAPSRQGASRQLFDEYLLTLLLENHPHNYSDEMRRDTVALPSIVRRAERLIREKSEAPLTVVELAADLGVGVRTLQAAFKTWRSTTPTAFLRQIRLDRVRDELVSGRGDMSVTDVALAAGFTHLSRFSAVYRQAFGECPHVTRRRSRHRPSVEV